MNMGLLTEHDMNAGDHTETTEVLLTLLSQNKALEGMVCHPNLIF